MEETPNISLKDISLKDLSKDLPPDYITICEWYNYCGQRCTKKSENNKFCVTHQVLINDFKLVGLDEVDVNCDGVHKVKIVPRSREHIVDIKKKLNMTDDEMLSNIIDVVVSNKSDITEEGLIEEDDYIELTADNAKYYYDSKIVKGKHKSKELKILFTKYCDNRPIIKLEGSNSYCKDCYKEIGLTKKFYPNLNVL